MLGAILAVVSYEAVTTAATLLGFKALSGAGLKKRMLSLNHPKQLPFIDDRVKKYVGPITNMEDRISKRAVSAIRRMSEYKSFRYLLILAGRKFRETKDHAKASSNPGRYYLSARCPHSNRRILGL